jgi:tetrahydromethanopterin S-methyltransferase subunit G
VPPEQAMQLDREQYEEAQRRLDEIEQLQDHSVPQESTEG